MADVGERVRVSHQTVSNYLNGASYVSAETRERVELAISDLGGAGHGLLAEIPMGLLMPLRAMAFLFLSATSKLRPTRWMQRH